MRAGMNRARGILGGAQTAAQTLYRSAFHAESGSMADDTEQVREFSPDIVHRRAHDALLVLAQPRSSQ